MAAFLLGTALVVAEAPASSTAGPGVDTGVTAAPPELPQPTFPIRAAFFYPWYPEAWRQNGISPFTDSHPSRGLLRLDRRRPSRRSPACLRLRGVRRRLYSWWGQGSKEDARLPAMLARTRATGSPVRWAIYHEREGNGPDPLVAQLTSDLDYIRSRYAPDPAYLKVDGKPVIFAYADAADGCGMVDRWHRANEPAHDFYVVLKVFDGYRTCSALPEGRHQYAPSIRADRQPSFSFSVSPGFDLTGPEPGRLPRDLPAFRAAVRQMVASGEPWQLLRRSTSGARTPPPSPRRSGRRPPVSGSTSTPSTTTADDGGSVAGPGPGVGERGGQVRYERHS